MFIYDEQKFSITFVSREVCMNINSSEYYAQLQCKLARTTIW